MAIIAADLYAKIQAINAKMLAEAKEATPDYRPFANGDDYFAGKVAASVSEALSVYTGGERAALEVLNAATAALSSALAGMTATPYAPLAGVLASWAGAVTAYIAAMKSGPDAPDVPVSP
jgi:hypothetical protein